MNAMRRTSQNTDTSAMWIGSISGCATTTILTRQKQNSISAGASCGRQRRQEVGEIDAVRGVGRAYTVFRSSYIDLFFPSIFAKLIVFDFGFSLYPSVRRRKVLDRRPVHEDHARCSSKRATLLDRTP